MNQFSKQKCTLGFMLKALFLFIVTWSQAIKAGNSEPGQDQLKFNPLKFEIREVVWQDTTVKIRAYENIVYVNNPSDPSSQRMNVYIPEAYFLNQNINGFNATTAPIFLPNQVGGYMPSQPLFLNKKNETHALPQPSEATVKQALARGFIVASPGTRGRTSQNSQGKYIGKAPATIVDLKAAVRYLRFNDALMPGDAEKIISNGTSAGGALSALLGASGNSDDFSGELKEISSAPVRDDIFAVSAYCPITDLEHADAAYEWQFDGIYDFKKIDISMLDYKIQRKEISGSMTHKQIATSNALKTLFPAYLNSLKLKSSTGQALTLDERGNGSFKEYIKQLVVLSAQKAAQNGLNIQQYPWLEIDDNKVKAINFDQYLHQLGRQKIAPAFDGLNLENGENQLFGDEHTDKRHFTDFSAINDISNLNGRVNQQIVNMTNPLHYIGNPSADNARFWRVRHGTKDKDTSLAVPTILALTLEKHDIPVDYELVWDRPHSGDYDLNELFDWMESITKNDSI
ncbi:subtype B tannase [Methylophilus sp. DW102]|uniref:subtype B tannase n=1 Tax=Methylophilus sp. DW102 TaxID=3095607 RepID=UPI00308CF846|nr:alpha/beta hydrolase [Methylophilus sp. DW102]